MYRETKYVKWEHEEFLKRAAQQRRKWAWPLAGIMFAGILIGFITSVWLGDGRWAITSAILTAPAVLIFFLGVDFVDA
jgi:Zn-dependent protease with chaperone function